MFNKLTDLSYERNLREAIGFYIAYFLLIIVLGGFFGGVAALISGTSSFSGATLVGVLVSVVVCLVLSFAIIVKKNIKDSLTNLAIALISGILAMFGGGLLGLIPVAYLSTRKKKLP